jgi:ankyrin repeat protein
MNLSDVSGDTSPKKSKKNRVFQAFRNLPVSFFFHNKKKDRVMAINMTFSLQALVGEIATHLYEGSDFNEKCKNMRKFSGINKTTYSFCEENEYTDRDIIRRLAFEHGRSDLEIAIFSGHKKMTQKIRDLFNAAKDPYRLFSVTDLQDTWLINATCPSKNEDIISSKQETLLTIAIKNFDIKKMEALLHAGADYNVIDPIALMVVPQANSFNYLGLHTSKQRDFLFIVTLLLTSGMHPDNRYMVIIPTLLHLAAFNDDKKFARVLLEEYNANPYKLYIERSPFDWGDIAHLEQQLGENSPDDVYFAIDNNQPDKYNAFTLEQGKPRGWLKIMYDEIQRKKGNRSSPLA